MAGAAPSDWNGCDYQVSPHWSIGSRNGMVLLMNQTVMDWPCGCRRDDFRGLDRLMSASSRGCQAAEILQKFRIMDILSDFDPVVAGTLPIGIDTTSSDIDILCHASDLDRFRKFVMSRLNTFAQFSCHDRAATENVGAAVVVRFVCGGFPVEIFATNCPVMSQFGFLHMLVEARILHLMGPDFAKGVLALKMAGVKTEPAFAQLLGLDGDPYILLGEMADMTPGEMHNRLVSTIRK